MCTVNDSMYLTILGTLYKKSCVRFVLLHLCQDGPEKQSTIYLLLGSVCETREAEKGENG